MKKILLTSGTSFSSIEDGDDSIDIEKWPSILSKKLDYRLINKSRPAASNMYIYDHLMENIIRYEDEIGLVVASWYYGFKASILRNMELNLINLHDQEQDDPDIEKFSEKISEKLFNRGAVASSIEQTLRLIVYLQQTCDSKNIKCIHYPLLNIFKTNLEEASHVRLVEQITNSEMFQRIDRFDNIIGWPCDFYFGGYTFNTMYPEHVISHDNKHPNLEGQKIIAQEIYNKYIKMIGHEHD